jgi:hypothetical protein
VFFRALGKHNGEKNARMIGIAPCDKVGVRSETRIGRCKTPCKHEHAASSLETNRHGNEVPEKLFWFSIQPVNCYPFGLKRPLDVPDFFDHLRVRGWFSRTASFFVLVLGDTVLVLEGKYRDSLTNGLNTGVLASLKR